VAAAQAAAQGGDPQAATLTAKALERAQDNTELRFWLALDMASQGDLETAVTILRDVIRQDERWLELLRRLPPADLLKPELLAQLEDRLKTPSTRTR
jgi:thioredoxin-like negative regulator of GroEL